jgi:hypothetical protein
MDSTTQLNPYSVTGTSTDPTISRRRIRLATWLGLTVGGTLLTLVLIMAGRIPYLYIRYPGLTDPPSRPVDYWPGLEVELSTIAIVLTTPIVLAILVPTVLSLRRQLNISSGRENSG